MCVPVVYHDLTKAVFVRPCDAHACAACTQAVADNLLAMEALLQPLPQPELHNATSDHALVGCCNMRCANKLPGAREKDAVLLRCYGCKRAVYCSAACKEAAWPQHQYYCQWYKGVIEL